MENFGELGTIAINNPIIEKMYFSGDRQPTKTVTTHLSSSNTNSTIVTVTYRETPADKPITAVVNGENPEFWKENDWLTVYNSLEQFPPIKKLDTSWQQLFHALITHDLYEQRVALESIIIAANELVFIDSLSQTIVLNAIRTHALVSLTHSDVNSETQLQTEERIERQKLLEDMHNGRPSISNKIFDK